MIQEITKLIYLITHNIDVHTDKYIDNLSTSQHRTREDDMRYLRR